MHDYDLGTAFELREINNVEKGMSPIQIWSCEAQERYIIAVVHGGLAILTSLASRERCGFSVPGTAEGNIQEEKKTCVDGP